MRPHLAFALVFTAALSLVGLGAVPLTVPDEAREAEIAREVWQNGPLHAPRLDGVVDTEKPPLTYWATAMVYAIETRLGGASAPPSTPPAGNGAPEGNSPSAGSAQGERGGPPPDWAARVAPAIFTLGMCLTTFLLGRGWFSTRHGALAALILAASPQVLASGRHALTDPALGCFVTIAVGSAITTLRAVRGRRFLGFLACSAIGLALAFLAKGPIAFALAIVAISAAIFLEWGLHGFFQLRALTVLVSALLCLAPAVGLWLWIIWRDGGMPGLHAYLDYHVGGVTGASREHVQPWWFYLEHGPVAFLPWLALLPFAGLGRAHALAPGGHPEFRLRQLVGWVIGPLVLLSLVAQKRQVYALPLFPPLAMLAACAILEPPREGRAAMASRVAWALAFLVALVAGTAGPAALAVYAFVEERAHGAPVSVLSGIAVAGVCFACGAAATILLARRDAEEREAPLAYPFMTVSLAAIFALALFVFIEPRLPRAARTHSLRPSARALAAELAREPGATLYGFALSEAVRGAVPYELGRTFPLLERADDVRARLEAEPGARVLLEGDARERLGSPGRAVATFPDAKYPLVLVGPATR